MSRRSFIDSVEVKSPCTEDWEKMHGNDRVRFCSHCAKRVNNLSEMTRKEATQMVRDSGGSLCIRYIKHPTTHRPMFADQLIQLTRRAPGLTASVMSASMALSTHAYAQGGVAPDPPPAPLSIERVEKTLELETEAEGENQQADQTSKGVGSIKGIIMDAAGAVVPSMSISAVNAATNAKIETTSNEDGAYELIGIEAGKWNVTVAANYGFTEAIRENIAVSAGRETPVNFELSAMGTFVTVGITAMIEYSSPLSSAIADGDVERVRELIIHGANINEKESEYSNITPLFVAVENGNTEIVRMLLDFGAKVNVRDSSKETPLMRLDEDATAEIVELLVKHGAKVNRKDDAGNTALLKATRSGASADVIKALIAAGAEVNAVSSRGWGRTALMNAADNDDIESVRALLMASAKVNLKDDDGDTAFDLTSETEIEELLLEHGADPLAGRESQSSKTPEKE